MAEGKLCCVDGCSEPAFYSASGFKYFCKQHKAEAAKVMRQFVQREDQGRAHTETRLNAWDRQHRHKRSGQLSAGGGFSLLNPSRFAYNLGHSDNSSYPEGAVHCNTKRRGVKRTK